MGEAPPWPGFSPSREVSMGEEAVCWYCTWYCMAYMAGTAVGPPGGSSGWWNLQVWPKAQLRAGRGGAQQRRRSASASWAGQGVAGAWLLAGGSWAAGPAGGLAGGPQLATTPHKHTHTDTRTHTHAHSPTPPHR